MAVNKVVYNSPDGQTTLIDLTEDTVTSDNLLNGVTAHDKTGTVITGTVEVHKYYTGSTEPDSSLGEDGDLYLMT